MKKYYYAFVGNINTTFGSPNKRTGRYSVYGHLRCFDSRKERDTYCTQYNPEYNSYPIPCNKRTARQYFLSVDVIAYQEWIELLNSGDMDYI